MNLARRVAITCLAVTALTATPASGHYSHGWRWDDYHADLWLQAHYPVDTADCSGFGPHIRRDGQRYYKHFDCFTQTFTDEGTRTHEGTLHVLGRRRAEMRWDRSTF